VLFIVNPASGAGKAGREWKAVESWLPSSGLPYETAFTTRPLEATEIAQRAVKESRPVVVAVGGDGTLNEVVNGFFRNGAPIPTASKLAMVPLGTGGDFRRTLRIPLDTKAAIQIISNGLPRRLDAGCVTYRDHDGTTGVRHFINIADAGYGGEVVHRVNRSTKRLGPASFTVTALLALASYENKPMTVTIDGNTRELARAQQVVIANCQYFGGGMRMAPMADPSDGYLDLILVGDVNLLETVRGLGKIRSGTHLAAGNPKWSHQRARRVEVTSEVPVRVDVDGEQPGFLPAVFEIVPGALNVVVP
jgi:YegS/Rv2252/BmrU family lipid kinase